jgi:arylsulfatase A-like enzyme
MKAFISLFAVLAFVPAWSHAAVEKPNIVYVLADQWRASATGYAGDPNVKTPNLDRLAKEGLNFRNAVSVAPVCTPYRAALMTGRYPTSTGMFLNDAHLPESELCMAEILRAAGYATAYIGKWHLDGHGRTSYIPPERRQGWDYWKAAECDHDYNHSHYYTGTSDVKRFWDGYDAFAETKDAEQYIRGHADNARPFILFIAYGVPHFPHGTAPAEFKALYPPDKIKLPPNVPETMEARARQEAQGYYAHCTALDRCVGDLLTTLAETGLSTNTIIVFTSDHGEMLGAHGVPPYTKQVAWSDAAQVPFLLRYPAVHGLQGRAVQTPLTTPDILPTLLGLVGVGIPRTVEGEDLSPVIRSGRESDRAALYMGVAPFVAREFGREYRAIRTSRYTYVRNLEGPWMLFDDQKDPCQMNNLVGKPEHSVLVQKLEGRLQGQLKRIGDKFRPAADYIKEWGYEIAPHGSIAYDKPGAKPQTPRRQPPAGQAPRAPEASH